MAKATDRQKELWVGWTNDAISQYVLPDGIDDPEEHLDDMIEFVT